MICPLREQFRGGRGRNRRSNSRFALQELVSVAGTQLQAGDVGVIMKADDPVGMQIIVEQRIEAKEIMKVPPLPQVIGWRYLPHAHEESLYVCPCCVRRGQPISRKLREAWEYM
jgi:hypothetical protein